jgi:hypothetical protein
MTPGAETDQPNESPTKQQRTNQRRNAERGRARGERDRETMSKYLPESLEEVFNKMVEGLDNRFKPPSWLLRAIQEVADAPAPPPKSPPIRFATDAQSLTDNAELLECFDFDLTELLDHFADITLGYGSEFRPTEQLDKLFHGHPHFELFRTVLRDGMDYFFEADISEDQRTTELEANLERGDHKSATSRLAGTESMLEKDVRHGFSLPFPHSLVKADLWNRAGSPASSH